MQSPPRVERRHQQVHRRRQHHQHQGGLVPGCRIGQCFHLSRRPDDAEPSSSTPSAQTSSASPAPAISPAARATQPLPAATSVPSVTRYARQEERPTTRLRSPPGGRGGCSESACTTRPLRLLRAVRAHPTAARDVLLAAQIAVICRVLRLPDIMSGLHISARRASRSRAPLPFNAARGALQPRATKTGAARDARSAATISGVYFALPWLATASAARLAASGSPR